MLGGATPGFEWRGRNEKCEYEERKCLCFDAEDGGMSEKCGPSSTAVDRVCFLLKCFSITSLGVSVVFFAMHYVETQSYHAVPKEVVFEDLTLKTKWPAKGKVRVLLVKNGVTVFSSSCDGLNETVCKKDNLGKDAFTKEVRAIELKTGEGILKDGEIGYSNGSYVSFENREANRYIKEYPSRGFYPAYMSFASFLGFGVAFFISIFVRKILFKE